jgi:hypothetical protein
MPIQYLFVYSYKRIGRQPKDGHPIKRPNVQVAFENNEKVIKTICLLDSGADRTFLTLDIAEFLELELSKKSIEINTPGKPINVKTANVTMRVVKGKDYFPLGNFLCYVFLKPRADLPPIIGRDPFFNYFDISFNQIKNEVRLRHYKFHQSEQ